MRGPMAVLLLLAAAPASAQTVVYTNIVDGRPTDRIVKVLRETGPSIPVPPSIVTTEVLPRNWHPPLGPTGYVPPQPQPAAVATLPRRQPRMRSSQPWFVNGMYAGPSPTGGWLATSVGRPIVDVNIVGTPRRPQSATRTPRSR